jgi:hypothetical protein
MRGVPVQVTVPRGGETATVYGATGTPIKLPIRQGEAGAYTLAASELLSGLSARTRINVTGAAAPSRTSEAAAVARFAARKDVPLVIALTPEQAGDAATRALAKRLRDFYAKRGRKVGVGRAEPNGVVLSLQPLRGLQTYPRWKTVDTDLVLLGTPANNVLLFDQMRGHLLPEGSGRLAAGRHRVRVTYSPFVGERQALNILAPDAAGLSAGVDTVVRVAGLSRSQWRHGKQEETYVHTRQNARAAPPALLARTGRSHAGRAWTRRQPARENRGG